MRRNRTLVAAAARTRIPEQSSKSEHVWPVSVLADVAPELVCIDSGCNKLTLIESNGVEGYAEALNSFLRTAQAAARLQIAGRGRIGVLAVMHIPGATANLMSTNSIVLSEFSIEIGMLDDQFYCIIHCHKNVVNNR